jgi:hypothetical protein
MTRYEALKVRSVMTILLLFGHALMNHSMALEPSAELLTQDLLRYRNIEVTEQGFLRNQGSDGYLVLKNLNVRRDQACALKMDIEFESPMQRPGLFEVFWHGPESGFSEQQKAFVIISHANTLQRTTFIIPLCKMYHYSGNLNKPNQQSIISSLRLDFPSNRTIAIKWHSLEVLNAQQMMDQLKNTPQENIVLEPYERVRAESFLSFDVALPKLYFALEEGWNRLQVDILFLLFWLGLIFALLVLIVRSLIKQ